MDSITFEINSNLELLEMFVDKPASAVSIKFSCVLNFEHYGI